MENMTWNLHTALEFVSFAKLYREDLPDGQWDALKDVVAEYRDDYGRRIVDWPESAKLTFTDEVKDNYYDWL